MHGRERNTEPTPPSGVTLGGYTLDALSAEVEALQPGMAVGPYRLLRPLGQGGMGAVWLAEQTQPFHREVAVKLLARALDDHLAEACFLVERQALARLVHPSIAQIYDAGQLPGGALFFALEYVDGRTLDRYVAEQKPALAQLVELFERICDGVHHAHQRGLIHRDLKPANLLVREDGPRALPKIIDFGIAIGTGTGQAVRIERSAAVGTLAYMAPEQARPDDEGIDARVDVYALGATLGKMLCLSLQRNVEGNEVHSVYAATLGAREARSTPGADADAPPLPKALLRALQRLPVELRTIVCKATEAERSQRYDSAAALAADLANWRQGRRVVAMGEGVGYALRHLLHRHRWASVGVLLVAAALLIGSAVALYGLGQARNARHLAEQRRVQAEELVGAMLGDLANRLRPLGRLDLLETVASEAMRYLRAAGGGNSGSVGALQRARALRTLGEVYNGRQQWPQAAAAFAEARATLDGGAPGARPGDAAAWLFESAQIAYFQGYLAYRKADHGNAERYFQDYLRHAEALQALTTGDGTGLLETSYALNNLGILSAEMGRLDEAIARYERSIALKRQVRELRPQDPALTNDLAENYSWIGTAQELSGHPREALANYELQRELSGETLKAKPDEARWAYQHGVALHLTALMRYALNAAEARNALQDAVHWLQSASTVDPSNNQWRRALASAYCDLGWNDALMGAPRPAREALTEGLKQAGTLSGDALDARTVFTLMRLEARLAQVLLQEAEPIAAREHLQQALRWLEQVPSARQIEGGEAAHVYWVAAALARAEQQPQAQADYLRKAATLVAAIDPASMRYLDLQARALAALLSADNGDKAVLESLRALGYDVDRVLAIAHIYQGKL